MHPLLKGLNPFYITKWAKDYNKSKTFQTRNIFTALYVCSFKKYLKQNVASRWHIVNLFKIWTYFSTETYSPHALFELFIFKQLKFRVCTLSSLNKTLHVLLSSINLFSQTLSQVSLMSLNHGLCYLWTIYVG